MEQNQDSKSLSAQLDGSEMVALSGVEQSEIGTLGKIIDLKRKHWLKETKMISRSLFSRRMKCLVNRWVNCLPQKTATEFRTKFWRTPKGLKRRDASGYANRRSCGRWSSVGFRISQTPSPLLLCSFHTPSPLRISSKPLPLSRVGTRSSTHVHLIH